MRRGCRWLVLLGLLLCSACPAAPDQIGIVPFSRNGLALGFEAAWSPDGSQLAIYIFQLYYHPSSYAHVYLLDGQTFAARQDWELVNPAQLYVDSAYDALREPALNWTADGQTLTVLQQNGASDKSIESLYLHTLHPGQSAIETHVYHLPLKFNDKHFLGYSHLTLAPDGQSLALLERESLVPAVQASDSPASTAASPSAASPQASSNPEDENLPYISERIQPLLYRLSDQALSPLGESLTVDNLQPLRALHWDTDGSGFYLLYKSPVSHAQSERSVLVRIGTDGRNTNLFAAQNAEIDRFLVSPDSQRVELDFSQMETRSQLDSVPHAQPAEVFVPPTAVGENYLFRALLEPAASRLSWYGSESGLDDGIFWSGPNQLACLEPLKEWNQRYQNWSIWDFTSQQRVASYRQPALGELRQGDTLAMAPSPRRQILFALYSLCCGKTPSQTGIYLWEMGRDSLRRIGPDAEQLKRDFPGLPLDAYPTDDLSQVRQSGRIP